MLGFQRLNWRNCGGALHPRLRPTARLDADPTEAALAHRVELAHGKRQKKFKQLCRGRRRTFCFSSTKVSPLVSGMYMPWILRIAATFRCASARSSANTNRKHHPRKTRAKKQKKRQKRHVSGCTKSSREKCHRRGWATTTGQSRAGYTRPRNATTEAQEKIKKGGRKNNGKYENVPQQQR